MPAYDNPGLSKGVAQPSHIERGEADVFVLGSSLLADNPYLLSKYFKKNNSKMTFMSKLKAFGWDVKNTTEFKDGVGGPVIGHYEQGRMNNILTVAGTGTTVNANTVRIAIDNAQHVTQTDFAGNTQRWTRPRVKEVYELANRRQYRVIAKDTTVFPQTVTLEDTRKTGNAAADIVAGAKMFWVNTPYGEGMDQPTALSPRRYKYQNTFIIIKDTDVVSGTHMTTTAPFQTVPGTNLIYKEGLEDMEMRHELQKGNTFLIAQPFVNVTDFSTPLNATVPVTGTQGLIDFIIENGREFIKSPGDYTIDDMYALASYFNDARVGSNEVMLGLGYDANVGIERALADRINYTWVAGVSDRYMANSMRNARSSNSELSPEDIFVSLGISGFSLGGYTFMKTVIDEFSDIANAGSSAFYRSLVLAMPFGLAKNADNTPYIGYEWRGTPGYSRENELWGFSGAGNEGAPIVKGSQWDIQSKYVRSEIAPHFAMGEYFGIMHS